MELKASSLFAAPEPNPVAEAIAACESLQNRGLVRVRAMLQLRFPEQATFMFHDFLPGSGMAAVLNVSNFLERRGQLESGVDRKATRKVDHQALAFFDELGVTTEFVKELEGRVETAQAVVTVSTSPTAAKRDVTLRKIHAWLTAWGEMARTVITRRDQLIRLGIAKRRAPKGKPPVVPATPAPPPVAVGGVTPAAPSVATVPAVEAHDTAPESDAA
jgi:hypothetical protein